jgi:glycosyltransferase involved in cell wall biosynthesis
VRVLIGNNFFANIGGAENSTYRTGCLLSAKGHQVFYFATDKQPFFEPAYPYARFFPAYTEYNGMSPLRALAALHKPFYNFEARRNMAAMLDEVRPDIVHLNGIVYQLTPSVIAPCVKKDIPVVLTLRDSFLFCPNIVLMYRAERYCRREWCVSGSVLNCLRFKCVDQRLINSAVATAEFIFRRLHRLFERVALFICTSEAMHALALRAGVPADKLMVINNFVEDALLNAPVSTENDGYFLYAGRLTQEKGISDLIGAAALVPGIEVRISGKGPMAAEYAALARRLNADNVRFIGFNTGNALAEAFRRCTAVVMPSNCFETFGMTTIEAYSYGKPVIGSRVGGMIETIEHGATGLLFEPEDRQGLAGCMRQLHADKDAAAAMGRAGKERLRRFYSAEGHYALLEAAYRKAAG